MGRCTPLSTTRRPGAGGLPIDPNTPQTQQTPPRTRTSRIFYGWYIVAASVFSNALLTGIVFAGFGAFVIPIEQTFGWSRSTISVALAIRQVESGIVSPVVGFAVDRFGARRIIFLSALTVGLGLIALGQLTAGIVTFYVFFILIAVGTSGVSHAVTWPFILSRWFRRKRGLAIGLAVLGPPVGSVLVSPNAVFEGLFGWRNVVTGYGVALMVLLTLMAFIARDRPEPYGLRPDGDPPEGPEDTPERRRLSGPVSPLPMHEIVRNRSFWLATVYLAGMFIGTSGFLNHEVPFFVNDFGLSAELAGVMVTLTFMLSALGRIGAGALMDRYDYRVVMVASSLLMTGSLVYAQFVDMRTVWLGLPMVLLFGISFGSNIPMRSVLGPVIFGNRAGAKVIGLLNGSTLGAGFIGPLMMGILFDWHNSYALSIWALAVICLAMAALPLAMRSTRQLEAAQE